ncbi:MAG: hypothetical protein H7242_15990 [Microbacteriaceae bacterium]|nr:hypothetical protein [Burkholderiaceae bacterium]
MELLRLELLRLKLLRLELLRLAANRFERADDALPAACPPCRGGPGGLMPATRSAKRAKTPPNRLARPR